MMVQTQHSEAGIWVHHNTSHISAWATLFAGCLSVSVRSIPISQDLKIVVEPTDGCLALVPLIGEGEIVAVNRLITRKLRTKLMVLLVKSRTYKC
jgi:hypothetical protein